MTSIVLPPALEPVTPSLPSTAPTDSIPPSREELVKRLRAKCSHKTRVQQPPKDALASMINQSLSSSNNGCPHIIQDLLTKMGTKKVRRDPLGFAKKVLASIVQQSTEALNAKVLEGDTKSTNDSPPQITMVPPPPSGSIPPTTTTPPVPTKPRRRGRKSRRPSTVTCAQWLKAHQTTVDPSALQATSMDQAFIETEKSSPSNLVEPS